MEVVKLTKKMLRMYPHDLLVELGAVNKEKATTFPQHVYFSKEDYQKLEQYLKRKARAHNRDSGDKYVNFIVGIEMFNYGPNSTLAEAIRPGFALVDYEEIEKAK